MKNRFIIVWLFAFVNLCHGLTPPRYSPFHIHERLKEHAESVEAPFFFPQSKPNNFDLENVDDVIDSVKAMAEKTAQCWGVPGFNFGIVIKNQTFLLTAGLDESINSDTNFGIGSTSKAFTSMLVAELVDEGKLDWNTPVKEYTPRFAMFDPVATERVTIRDMLTHKTGMPDHSYDLGVEVESQFTRSELFYAIKTLLPGYDFRSQWQYSNLMVMAAGHVAEEVTGTSWEDLVTERIFHPVGMKRTCPDLDCALAEGNLAMPTLLVSSDPVSRVDGGYECNRWLTPENPSGGIYSNVKDLTKWIQVHLNTSGMIFLTDSEVELVKPDTLKELHTPQTSLFPYDPRSSWVPAPGEFISIETHSYAFNWVVENYRGWRHVEHGGTTWGFNSQISLLPDIGVGFVGLSSGDNTNNALLLLAYYTFDLLLYKKSWVTESQLCPAPQQAPIASKSKSHKLTQVETSDVSDYAGSYEHPFFGTITFSYDNNHDLLYGTWQTASGNTTYVGDALFTWHVSVNYFPTDFPGNALGISEKYQWRG
mmetsp:Transcript_8427/g.11631  ORF Transcript_8427/g.11631 Transcript_8427/m.11631 type:complete len:536 (+) Transcript_8427:25-1632(+)